MDELARGDFLYHPFYCEENIWHLCQHPKLAGRVDAIFISNPTRSVALWNQQVGKGSQPVMWDYHVIALERAPKLVWDLNTALGLPVPLDDYLLGTFAPDDVLVAEDLRPLFGVVDGEEYVDTFASDRSHMLDEAGSYMMPPPPWPAIGEGRPNNLQRLIGMEAGWIGQVTGLHDL